MQKQGILDVYIQLILHIHGQGYYPCFAESFSAVCFHLLLSFWIKDSRFAIRHQTRRNEFEFWSPGKRSRNYRKKNSIILRVKYNIILHYLLF